MAVRLRVMIIVPLVLVSLPVVSSGKQVDITDDETLKEYLCPPSGTLPPHTTLVLSRRSFRIENQEQFCLIENTTDLAIIGIENVTIQCLNSTGGFGFFNITNLNITSVSFRFCAVDSIPPSALRYVNDSDHDQFLYYDINTGVGHIFNHCYNVSIYNLLHTELVHGIIGVNLCGHSSINITVDLDFVFLTRMLFYYTDSKYDNITTECNLHVQSNAFSSLPLSPSMEESLSGKPNQLPIWIIPRGLALVLAQQTFNANLDINIVPLSHVSALVVFVNAVTSSLVSLRGLSYDYCRKSSPDEYYQLSLSVSYYETPDFNTTFNESDVIKSLKIKDIYFLLYLYNGRAVGPGPFALLQITKISGNLSHQIEMENVSWCTVSLPNPDCALYSTPAYLIHMQTFKEALGNLHVDMVNVYMNKSDNSIIPLSASSSVNFVNVKKITLGGTNYFAISDGGSILNVVSSNLTITGELTVRDGYALEGGGIRLDGSSTLFLKEPLKAKFIDNTAYQGSAIYAPIHKVFGDVQQAPASVQFLPSQAYLLENITDINIKVHFEGNINNNLNASISLYIPQLNFLYDQKSPKFLFNRSIWDENHHQYAYTTLFDAMFKFKSKSDKYSSLLNGVCVQIHEQPLNCTFIDNWIHNSSEESNFLQPVYASPGERIVSVLLMNNKEFIIMNSSDCNNSNYQRMKFKFYPLTKSASTASFTFLNTEKKPLYFCIVLINIEVQELRAPIIQVIVNATCPLGFNLTDEGNCICLPALHAIDTEFKCDINTRTITSPEGYWTSYHEEHDSSLTTLMLTSNCPPNYCYPEFHSLTLDNFTADSSCLNNRTGVMCGTCKQNYSAVFGSDVCSEDCSHIYLLTLPVYALAGLILVVILFVLKLTVAFGTINGVVFYANILGLSLDRLTESYNHEVYSTVFHIVISLLNLELGFPLCFYEEMSTTAKVGFQFIFPVYIWSIVIGMIIVSNYSIRVSNLIAGSSVQVLATLFYLSFSKVLRTVIDIFSPSTLHLMTYNSSDDSYTYSEKIVWFYNGDEGYGHGIHGFYIFLATAFVVLFLLPYTILVTFSYCFMRFRLVNRFKPLIDAYGGPFKDNLKFWFGFRLWLTILLFSVSSALQGDNSHTVFIFIYVTVLIFILIQAFVNPFQSSLVSLVDLFFMLDYWLIIGFYLYSEPKALAYLLSSAIFVMIVILLSHFSYVFIYSKYQLKMRIHNAYLQLKMRIHNGYAEVDNQVDEDDQVFEADENRHQLRDTY